MEKRELTCIVCPVGCRVTVEIEGAEMRVSGNQCKRGDAYCRQEVSCPMRTVTSLVAVSGGEHPLCPVKTSHAIPRAKIADVLAILRTMRVKTPVAFGYIVVAIMAGPGADIVATDSRAARVETAAE